jgi:hypothetical protein
VSSTDVLLNIATAGLIYLDLADEFWRCVEIGAKGSR